MPLRWRTPFRCFRPSTEQMNHFLKEVEQEYTEHCERKEEEYKAVFSKQLQEAEERLQEIIFDVEKNCKALVADRRNLESIVLQVNGKIEVISAELEAAYKGWKLEKDELSSKIVAARQETEDITKRSQMAEQAWNTYKEKFLSALAACEKKIEELVIENERVLVQSKEEKIELESRLNKFMARIEELAMENERILGQSKEEKIELESRLNKFMARIEELALENERVLVQSKEEKLEFESKLNKFMARTQELLEDKQLWISKMGNLGGSVAELQRKLDLMTSEKGLLSQKITELGTESESLKAQLNLHNARLTHLEDGAQKNEGVLCHCRTENIDLQFGLIESKQSIQYLLRKIEEERQLRDAEKRKLEANLAALQTDFELMSNEMDSMMIRKSEEERQLRDEEKRKLEANLAALQTAFELMSSEMDSMIKKNMELCADVEFLKTREKEYNVTPICMQEEKPVLKSESSSNEERLESLLARNAKTDINNFWQQVHEGAKQRLNLIQQYKETENSLQQEEKDGTRVFPQTQNQRVEEMNTALHSLRTVLESKTHHPWHVKSVVLDNGESNNGHETTNGKPPNGLLESGKPNHSHECRDEKPNGLHGEAKVKPNGAFECRPPNGKPVNERKVRMPEMPTPPKPVAEMSTSSKLVPVKQTPKGVPGKQPSITVPPKPWR